MAILSGLVPSTIKARLSVTLGLLVTVMVAVPSYLSYRSAAKSEQERLEREMTRTATEVLKRVTVDQAEQLRLIARTVASTPTVHTYMLSKDREYLLEFAGPLYEELKKNP